jgi:hypothetical protein
LKIQAAKTGFARATSAIQILVEANVGATKGTAENDVLFIYSVVSSHLDSTNECTDLVLKNAFQRVLWTSGGRLMEVARTLSLNQIGAPKARLAKVMPLSIKYIHT